MHTHDRISPSRIENRNNILGSPDSICDLRRVLERANDLRWHDTLATHTRARRVGSCGIRNDVVPANPEIFESVNPRIGVSYGCFWIRTNSSGPSDMQGQTGFLMRNTNRHSALKDESESADISYHKLRVRAGKERSYRECDLGHIRHHPGKTFQRP